MKHKIVVTALTALATIGITFVSCSKDNEGYEERDARLSISVNTAEMPKTKALIEETTLPEGSKIGVSLKNLDGEIMMTGNITTLNGRQAERGGTDMDFYVRHSAIRNKGEGVCLLSLQLQCNIHGCSAGYHFFAGRLYVCQTDGWNMLWREYGTTYHEPCLSRSATVYQERELYG